MEEQNSMMNEGSRNSKGRKPKTSAFSKAS